MSDNNNQCEDCGELANEAADVITERFNGRMLCDECYSKESDDDE